MQSIGGKLMAWLTPTRLTAHSTQIESNGKSESAEARRSQSVAGFQNLTAEKDDSGAYCERQLSLSNISPIEIQSDESGHDSTESYTSNSADKTMPIQNDEIIVIDSECSSQTMTPVTKPWNLHRIRNCENNEISHGTSHSNASQLQKRQTHIGERSAQPDASTLLQNSGNRLRVNEIPSEPQLSNEIQCSNVSANRRHLNFHETENAHSQSHLSNQKQCDVRDKSFVHPSQYDTTQRYTVYGGGDPHNGYLQKPHVAFRDENEYLVSQHRNDNLYPQVNGCAQMTPQHAGNMQYSHNNSYDSPSRPFRKHKEPMRFNGKMDWEDYHSHFHAVAEWNGWGIHECGLQLAMSLVDDAREILSSIPVSDQSNYPVLVNALKQRYAPDGKESSYSMELMNRVRKAGEDTTAYGYALMKLAKRAYPHQPLPEQALVNLYINGLNDKELKRHVYLCKPGSLDGAIKIAATYEGFDEKPRIDPRCEKYMKKPKGSDINVVSTSTEAKNEGLTNDLLKTFEKAISGLTERLEKLEKGRTFGSKPRKDKSTIECFRCKKMGHYSSECPEHPDSTNRSTLNDHQSTRTDSRRHLAGQPLN